MAKKPSGTAKPAASETSRRPSRIVVDRKRKRGADYRLHDARASVAWLLTAVGTAFVLVGAVDLALRWTPPRLGTPGWEFAAVSQTFTNLPMTVLGLVLLVVGVLQHPRRSGLWSRVAAVGFGLLAVLLVGMGLLFVTAVPAVAHQAGDDATEALIRAVIKNGAEMAIYPLMFAFMSVVLWRGVERQPK